MSKKGYKQSPEHVAKRMLSLRGKTRPAFSPEWREALSKAHLGQRAWNKGKPVEKLRGDAHWNWKGGVSSERHLAANSVEWKKWREEVFKRDGYSCVDCGHRGYLEPHHIIPVRSDKSKLFDITNGITLCRPCHMATFRKEIELSGVYMTLAARAA